MPITEVPLRDAPNEANCGAQGALGEAQWWTHVSNQLGLVLSVDGL